MIGRFTTPFAVRRRFFNRAALALALLGAAACSGWGDGGEMSEFTGVQPQAPNANASPGTPAIQSPKIHGDSPATREDVLSKRSVTDGTNVPVEVPPLPAQAIAPPASMNK